MLAGLGPRPQRAQLLGNVEAGRQRVLVEAVAAVAAAEIGGVQPHRIGGVGKGAEQGAPALSGVGEQRQRLVGMAGQYALVEAVPVTRRVAHLSAAFGVTTKCAGWHAEPRLAAERTDDAFDI